MTIRYEFKGITFIPDKIDCLIVGDVVKQLPRKEKKVLTYLLDANCKVCKKEELIEYAWGPGIHRNESLTAVMHKLKRKLHPLVTIDTDHGNGYCLNVKAEKSKDPFGQLTEVLSISKNVKITFSLLTVMIILAALPNLQQLYYYFYPKKSFSLVNKRKLSTVGFTVQYPKISPSGQYIAHNLSDNLFINDKLGLLSTEWSETKPLVPINFNDGFDWSLDGSKIVYQRRQNNQCQIRLLSFNRDKSDFNDNHLINCGKNSGLLSFAWFSPTKFFVNLVASDNTNANQLPQHHLYYVDIDSLMTFKITIAKATTNLGFYAMAYDPTTAKLYLLQTIDGTTTDFYQYDTAQKTFSKIATVDYLVKGFTVTNNRMIMTNPKNELVINYPADDFTSQKVLLENALDLISWPHANGDQLTYLTGKLYRRSLKQWQNDKAIDIDLAGYEPRLIARFKNKLVFSSNQSGIYQIYEADLNGQSKSRPQRISNFKSNRPIQHIEVSNNLFAISYTNKVEVYRYQQDSQPAQLELLHSFIDYTNGAINQAGTHILMSKISAENSPPLVVELSLADQKPTGVVVKHGLFGFYHQNQVMVITKSRELLRLEDDRQLLIAHSVNVDLLESTSLYQDKLYYIQQSPLPNEIVTIDLTTGKQTKVNSTFNHLKKIEVINGHWYFVTSKTLAPQIFTATIKTHNNK